MYELTINLQPGAKAPLYEQIYEHIKCEIQEGHIRSGEKLPSTRALSRHLEVSRSTVELAYGVDGVVQKRQAQYHPTHLMLLVAGITLCILSLVPLMVAAAVDEDGMGVIVGLILLFVFVAVGVFLLVRTCIIAGSFQRLLETGDYTRAHKQAENSPLATIYWGLVLALYLGWSFWTMEWQRTWLVWPVAAVLYAPVRAVAGLLTRK